MKPIVGTSTAYHVDSKSSTDEEAENVSDESSSDNIPLLASTCASSLPSQCPLAVTSSGGYVAAVDQTGDGTGSKIAANAKPSDISLAETRILTVSEVDHDLKT